VERGTTELVVRGRIGRADGAALCERARLLLGDGHHAVVVCNVGALTDADIETIEALARLQLTARRLGGTVRLRHASAELRELLHLAGLGAVVPCSAGLPFQPRGQAEHREEPRRVEEEGDPADPIA
jgi:ABC-type transporter Mla MlaB component